MKGRKPKAQEVRDREGSRSHHKGAAHAQVTLVGGRPLPQELAEPPDFLGDDGQAWWLRTVPALVQAGVVDRIDASGLEMLASSYDDFRKASRAIKIDGHFTRGSVGQLREHPSLKTRREAVAQYNRIGEGYGLGPLGRVRLGLAVLEGRSLAAEIDRLEDTALKTADPVWEGEIIDAEDVGLPVH